MNKSRMVNTEVWENLNGMDMSAEDKYFYLYLLTNELTTSIGVYKIARKKMAFDLGYSIFEVQVLMDRFIKQHKLIRYNPLTGELAIKNWWKDILFEGGRDTKDDFYSELIDVEDHSLILYVLESMTQQDLYRIFEAYYR